MEDSETADPGIEHADGTGIHSPILEPARLASAVRVRVALLGAVAAALTWSATALAATPVQLTIPVSDGTQLVCSLVEPDGTAPGGGWPAVMLFHGLGGTHQDMEPLAVQYLAPAGWKSVV